MYICKHAYVCAHMRAYVHKYVCSHACMRARVRVVMLPVFVLFLFFVHKFGRVGMLMGCST